MVLARAPSVVKPRAVWLVRARHGRILAGPVRFAHGGCLVRELGTAYPGRWLPPSRRRTKYPGNQKMADLVGKYTVYTLPRSSPEPLTPGRPPQPMNPD